MKEWLYVTAVSGIDTEGNPEMVFEHRIVRASNAFDACRRGWAMLCKMDPDRKLPEGFTRKHRGEYVVQLGQ